GGNGANPSACGGATRWIRRQGSGEQGLERAGYESPAGVGADEFVDVFADDRGNGWAPSVPVMHEHREQGATRRPAVSAVGEPQARPDVSRLYGRGDAHPAPVTDGVVADQRRATGVKDAVGYEEFPHPVSLTVVYPPGDLNHEP